MRPALGIIFLVLALVGFLDASYLTLEHYRGTVPPCSIIRGCEKVTTSQFSQVLGIPVALLGACYYLLIIILAIAYLDTKKTRLLTLAGALTPIGLLASLWFVYIQWRVIGAWCLYCLGSATTSTLLFVLGMFTLSSKKESWWERLKEKVS